MVVFSLLLAIGLVASVPARATVSDGALRIMRSSNPHRRYVRLQLDIETAGVHGTETSVFDLATGRFSERIWAGPLSSLDGFDGINSWSADATGMSLIEGNADA